ISTFLLSTVPHFLNYATIGYADFALIMFYSMSFIYLFSWIVCPGYNRYLLLCGVLSILALWTKQEAKMLVLVNIATLSLYLFFSRKGLSRQRVRPAFYYILTVVLCITAWLVFMNAMGFENELANRDTFRISVMLKNLNRVPLILYEYQKHVFGPKKWNLSFLIFFTGLIFYFKKAFGGNFKYITLSILMAFGGYAACFMITPLEIRYHLQTAGSRLLLHFLPIVIFWIGYLSKEIVSGEGNIRR
ncbi:MAG: hypothetical protein JW800_06705, partial [Candidatus Omnitrophica bacterium]|nr:hypothetical protein [Candidatus Omnitrophota bacterium]